MTTAKRTKIGFVTNSTGWGAHYDAFLAIVPRELDVQIETLELYSESLAELKDKGDEHVARTSALAKERGWQAVALMGAPAEVQNVDFLKREQAAIDVPVTTALTSGSAALKAFGVRRALLLTPFEPWLNDLLVAHLKTLGVEAQLRAGAFESVAEARALTPEQVHDLAIASFRAADGAEAIYFQGAPFNPLDVIEPIEAVLDVPVIASNPAMLWHAVSLVGERHPVQGHGRLLAEWPALAG
jgi:maleate cis-trans isomerase